MPTISVRIDSYVWEKLRKYKEKAGVPIAVALKQAVEYWLEKKAGKQ